MAENAPDAAGKSELEAAEAEPPPEIAGALSKVESSAEKNFWSRRHKVWKRFRIHCPRMPTEEDDPESGMCWDHKHFPASLDEFIGDNDQTLNVFADLAERGRLRNIMLCGPQSSGKTAAMETFLKQWRATVDEQRRKAIDTGELSERISKLLGKKKVFRHRKLPEPVFRLTYEDAQNMSSVDKQLAEWIKEMDKYYEIEQRVVFLEGLCRLSPNQQQWFYRIMDKIEVHGEPPRPVYFVFTVYDDKRIIGKLRMRGQLLRMEPLGRLPSLELFLAIIVKEEAGFEREGLELITQRVGPHLGHMLNMSQRIFFRHKYLSYINAAKETATEILDEWRASKLRFFEFQMLGDPSTYSNPWTGTITKVRVLNVLGMVSPANFLLTYRKTGQARQLARDAFHTEEARLKASVKRSETDAAVQRLTTPERAKRTHRGEGQLGAATPEETAKLRALPPRVGKENLRAVVTFLQQQSELVDQPWVDLRHVSDAHHRARADFALKRRSVNEWVFVDFLVLSSLLFDPMARRSAMEKILEERPVIRVEDLTLRVEGHIRKWPSDARMRDPRHNSRWQEATQLDMIDLGRPVHNFQVLGVTGTGMPKNHRERGGGFDASRTRWSQLKLHDYFDGRQCWRLILKSQVDWHDFGLGAASASV